MLDSLQSGVYFGNGWQETLGTFKTELGDYIPAADQNRISTVLDVESALTILKNYSV